MKKESNHGLTKNQLAKNYKWYRDSKVKGTLFLLLSVSMLIFSLISVPFFTTIHAYTIGMLVGYYGPLVYAPLIYFSLREIFGSKVYLPKSFKLNIVTYSFVVLTIIFVGTSTGYYQSKEGFLSIGSKPWGAFPNWFSIFTNSDNWWLPSLTNGGIVGAFLFSFFSMFLSGIGSFTLSIVLLVLMFSLIATGSFIGLYKDFVSKKKVKNSNQRILEKEFDKLKLNEEQKIIEEKELELNVSIEEGSNESGNDPTDTTLFVEEEKQEIENNIEVEDDDPFEDPFS